MFSKSLLFFITVFIFACMDLNADTALSQKVKEKKIYPMGKKIFEKMCIQDVNFTQYSDIEELKVSIKDLCKPLKENHLEAVSLYLWDVQRVSGDANTGKNIEVTSGEKCPVCGMFVHKYPKWAAQIYYSHENEERHLSFDGVKDLMKFYFHPDFWGDYGIFDKKKRMKILVSDYYSQKTIDAKEAYFVIGSDIYGPMGRELIPFANEKDAKTFYMDHKATKILRLEDIKEAEVNALDE